MDMQKFRAEGLLLRGLYFHTFLTARADSGSNLLIDPL